MSIQVGAEEYTIIPYDKEQFFILRLENLFLFHVITLLKVSNFHI